MFSFNQIGNLGELGNQMFQYAAIKGLAAKHNRDFMIAPREIFGKYYYKQLRSNLYDCFSIECKQGISNFQIHKERYFSFDVETFENPPKDDVDLSGFFQSDKWFNHIAHEIKTDFKFKDEFLTPSLQVRNQFTDEVIALHVRRTDFITNTNHVVQDISYYSKALELFPKESDVLIFTDDPEWCKKQSLFSGDRFYISESSGPYVDMCLITLCDYIAIANSSFSWWGAYLSKAKKIIAPSLWFPETNPLNASDIYCENWIVI